MLPYRAQKGHILICFVGHKYMCTTHYWYSGVINSSLLSKFVIIATVTILDKTISFSYMFWTDWGSPGKVERAYMDGTGRMTLADTSLVWPNDLTIDYDVSNTFYPFP